MVRDGFVFYKSFLEAVKDLDDETKLECLVAIIEYGLYGIERELSGIPAIVFKLVKPQIDANNKRFTDGKKGGRPKKNTDGLENKNQWLSEEKPKEKDKEDVNYQQIADLYNEICVSFPKLTKLSDSRRKAIRARLKKYSVEDIKKAFEMAEGSDFLKGSNNRNWAANFDWLMKDTNIAKVLDGNFTNKGGKIEIDNKLRQFINTNQVVDFGM